MGRFHVKKQDTFIDMTPMSDVMVLLLTFFMLTATFTKEEPKPTSRCKNRDFVHQDARYNCGSFKTCFNRYRI